MSRKPTKPPGPGGPDTPHPGTDDTVGYGRPPKNGQFQPGRSGNPKGRPKGTRNLATSVRTVLGRRITVTERGQHKSVSASEAILHRYLELAIKGNVKAGAFLLNLLERFQAADPEAVSADVLSDRDQEILQNFIDNVGTRKKGDKHDQEKR